MIRCQSPDCRVPSRRGAHEIHPTIAKIGDPDLHTLNHRSSAGRRHSGIFRILGDKLMNASLRGKKSLLEASQNGSSIAAVIIGSRDRIDGDTAGNLAPRMASYAISKQVQLPPSLRLAGI